MTKIIDQKQIFEILEKLPAEVKEVLFAEKTGDDIDNICKKYEVSSEKISEVAKYAGQVLLGILPAEKFSEILEKEVGLKKTAAGSVAHDIESSIFSQVSNAPKKPVPETSKTLAAKEPPSAQDIYREQVE